MTSEYKATGAQLKTPPEAKGLSWDQWMYKQTVATQAQISEWLDKERERVASKPKPSASKKKSGALPKNTEWL